MARSLYICYFGVGEPLVQTQVIPYLRELVKDGHEISLVTFEPRPEELQGDKQVEMEKELAEKGIDWHWLKYHKRFSAIATAYDVFRGALFVRKMIRQKNLDILHGRVHVPTLMGALGRKISRRNPKLLFDIRGFFPEEYTDAGIWPEGGLLYRSAKRIERWLMRESDGFVVLTEKARQLLFAGSDKTGTDDAGRPVAMIPCCVDLARFAKDHAEPRTEIRQRLGINDRTVIAYVGSFGGWYLSEEMFDFLRVAREQDSKSFALILTQRDKDRVIAKLGESGYTDGDFIVESIQPSQIPEYLRAADIALSFIKECYSKLGASPTKIAEYLACGVPIIANRGVGDIDQLLEEDGVGVLLDGFDRACYINSLKEIEGLSRDNGTARVCIRSASHRFDLLTVGGPRYRELYKRILEFE